MKEAVECLILERDESNKENSSDVKEIIETLLKDNRKLSNENKKWKTRIRFMKKQKISELKKLQKIYSELGEEDEEEGYQESSDDLQRSLDSSEIAQFEKEEKSSPSTSKKQTTKVTSNLL